MNVTGLWLNTLPDLPTLLIYDLPGITLPLYVIFGLDSARNSSIFLGNMYSLESGLKPPLGFAV